MIFIYLFRKKRGLLSAGRINSFCAFFFSHEFFHSHQIGSTRIRPARIKSDLDKKLLLERRQSASGKADSNSLDLRSSTASAFRIVAYQAC